MLDALARDADLVLVDTPPVLDVSDAESLAGRVDAVLLVVSAGSPADEVVEAAAALERAGGRVVGAVLNRGRPGDRSTSVRPAGTPASPAPTGAPPASDHRRGSVAAPA
jgi:non-specific protein-tyrosine kinase